MHDYEGNKIVILHYYISSLAFINKIKSTGRNQVTIRQCGSVFSCSFSTDSLKMTAKLKLMLSNLALLECKKNDSYFFERSASLLSYGV